MLALIWSGGMVEAMTQVMLALIWSGGVVEAMTQVMLALHLVVILHCPGLGFSNTCELSNTCLVICQTLV